MIDIREILLLKWTISKTKAIKIILIIKVNINKTITILIINIINPWGLSIGNKLFLLGQAFKLIQSKKKYNIFSQLGREEYILIRKRMINCVLTTDMINHAKLYSFIKVSIEKFNISKGSNVPKIFERIDKVKLYETIK